jgi:hypothetical protein
MLAETVCAVTAFSGCPIGCRSGMYGAVNALAIHVGVIVARCVGVAMGLGCCGCSGVGGRAAVMALVAAFGPSWYEKQQGNNEGEGLAHGGTPNRDFQGAKGVWTY